MTNHPKITIITVCFNAQATIEQTIQSVLQQDYPHIEYIIIDGKSTDNTMTIVNKYDTIISKIVSEPDQGIYDAMNKGLRLATGEIVGFLNADDHYPQKKIISLVMRCLENKAVEACYGDLIYYSDNKNKIIRYWQSSKFEKGYFAKGWSPPHPTFFVRRAVYEKYGFFNLQLPMGNDIELMMRFLEKYNIYSDYIPHVLVNMRIGGISNRHIKNIFIQNRTILQAARQLGISISPWLFIFYKLKNRFAQFIAKPRSECIHVK